MNRIVLLSLFLCACVKPIVPINQPKTCFAPAGNYMVVAALAEHNCTVTPKSGFFAYLSLGEKQWECGTRGAQKASSELGCTMRAVTLVTAKGMSGRMLLTCDKCKALYEVMYFKLR